MGTDIDITKIIIAVFSIPVLGILAFYMIVITLLIGMWTGEFFIKLLKSLVKFIKISKA